MRDTPFDDDNYHKFTSYTTPDMIAFIVTQRETIINCMIYKEN
ncbi:hypothetical protein Q7O_002198 [Pectobacterium carotovorum subsp. carotovorum PCCS1]|nr:hypothetical protein [Pectobacterium carotovorum subsp. carotovorum PCCS1]